MEINHIKQSAAGWLRWVPLALFVLTVLWMVFFQSLEKAVAFSAMDDDSLAAFSPFVLYVSEIKTKFENFSEPPKPFVVYTATPSQLEKIWKRRYGRMR